MGGALLGDLLLPPVEQFTTWVAGFGGRVFCHAIEWIAEPRLELGDPAAPHEHDPLVAAGLEVVEWRGHAIRVPPPAAQLRVAERRGLIERAALIRAALAGEQAPRFPQFAADSLRCRPTASVPSSSSWRSAPGRSNRVPTRRCAPSPRSSRSTR